MVVVVGVVIAMSVASAVGGSFRQGLKLTMLGSRYSPCKKEKESIFRRSATVGGGHDSHYHGEVAACALGQTSPA